MLEKRLALIALVAGCTFLPRGGPASSSSEASPAATSSAPTLVMHPGDAMVWNDRLHVGVTLYHPMHGALDFLLVGPSGTIKGTHFDSANRDSIECWGMGEKSQGDGAGYHPDLCDFVLGAAGPGEYHVEAVQQGQTVARGPVFSLIQIPSGAGHAPVLGVDAAWGAMHPFLREGRHFNIWLPVDPRRRTRLATVAFFSGETAIDSATRYLDAPPVTVGIPMVWLQPIEAQAKGAGGRGGQGLAWDTVVLVVGETTVIGGWRLDGSELAALTPSPAVRAKALELAKTAWAERIHRGKSMLGDQVDQQLATGYKESTLCAYAEDKKAALLVTQLRQLRESSNRAVGDYQEAGEVAADPLSTPEERRNAHATQHAVMNGLGGYDHAEQTVTAKLNALAGHYKPGCLAHVYPASFAASLGALN